ncbi:MAG TPA: DNA-binding domain-containing protein [Pyrinomonadaceae bacterium]|jgi:hypothetical protein
MSTGEQDEREMELSRIQRMMQVVVTRPAGDLIGVSRGAERGGRAASIEMLEEVVSPSSTLSGLERLAIYHRSYHARLLECFQAMFPALLQALGEDLFNRFALDYLQAHPPRSYTLSQLADAFPEHLAGTRPDADAALADRESWPDFIINLAALELAFMQVYDGPGVEGRQLPSGRHILALPLGTLLDARPALVPCLRLFAFRYPVSAYLSAARRGERPALPMPKDNFAVVTRRDYRVVIYEVSRSEYALLHNLDGRRTMGQALRRSEPTCDCALTAETGRGWLCDWADKGLLESL